MLERLDIKYFKLAVGLDNISKETDVDIAAKCPVCGDSRSGRKARLHLYNKGTVTNVNCFNGDCPVENKTVYSFLRDFYPALLNQYKKENFGNTVKNLANGNTDVFASLKKEEPKKESPVLVQDFSPFLTNINEAPQALEYIKKRGFEYNESKYGKWYYGHQDLKIGETLYQITNSLVIPLYYDGEMYGFYSRNIANKTFYTYMNDNNIGYKIWNWFNIDKNKPVYIFEGIFDAISSGLDNIIALMGAKLPDDRLKELKEPVFVLDNDKTGLLNSIKYVNMGYKVYVQPINFVEKDMNELMINHPEEKMYKLINSNIYSGISAEVRIKAKL